MTGLKELNSNFESLESEDMSIYAGQWIGIVKGKIVCHKETLKDVMSEVEENHPKEKALIGKVPEKRQLVLSVI